MPVEIAASDLLHTVNALLNDETGEEAKPWSDESQKTKILTVLDDHKEMMEASELTERTGRHDSCETIRGSCLDREKDGHVKSRLFLKDFNRSQARTQPELFPPTPSTLSLKTMLAASSHDRNNHPECDHITIASDVHTAFLHADVDKRMNQSCAKTKCGD